MKRLILLVAGLALCAGGCANTAAGLKADVSRDTAGVRTAAVRTGQAVKNAGASVVTASKNVGAAAELTPRIKTAILRDPVLNDSRNKINVDAGGTMVNIKGHVVTEAMKNRATEDVQAVLDKHHYTQRIHNGLQVTGGGG